MNARWTGVSLCFSLTRRWVMILPLLEGLNMINERQIYAFPLNGMTEGLRPFPMRKIPTMLRFGTR